MKKDRFPSGSSQYINKLNKIKILNIIRESGPISRADAAKIGGISAPTVTRVVDSLIQDEGLVREIGEGASKGGRRPTLLEFAGLDNFVIGIDLGTTHIYGVLANLNAEIITEIKCDTQVDEGPESIMARTADVICELQNYPQVKSKKIFGIGMAVAGLINREKNIVAYSPDFHWSNVDVVGLIRARCDLPVIFDNVTRVMALGELWYGIGTDFKNFIVVNIGYGIGSGIIINSRPLYGATGMAGEFGHITLERKSKVKCECGNYGCLEALASGRAIANAAQQELREDVDSILHEMSQGDISSVTAEMVANAASKGDLFAKQIFDKAAEYIGIGIAGLISLFSPEAVIIGGGVSQSGDLLFNTIRETVASRAMNTISRDMVIKPATFGLNAAVMGSVALILHEVLHLNYKAYSPKHQDLEERIGII